VKKKFGGVISRVKFMSKFGANFDKPIETDESEHVPDGKDDEKDSGPLGKLPAISGISPSKGTTDDSHHDDNEYENVEQVVEISKEEAAKMKRKEAIQARIKERRKIALKNKFKFGARLAGGGKKAFAFGLHSSTGSVGKGKSGGLLAAVKNQIALEEKEEEEKTEGQKKDQEIEPVSSENVTSTAADVINTADGNDGEKEKEEFLMSSAPMDDDKVEKDTQIDAANNKNVTDEDTSSSHFSEVKKEVSTISTGTTAPTEHIDEEKEAARDTEATITVTDTLNTAADSAHIDEDVKEHAAIQDGMARNDDTNDVIHDDEDDDEDDEDDEGIEVVDEGLGFVDHSDDKARTHQDDKTTKGDLPVDDFDTDMLLEHLEDLDLGGKTTTGITSTQNEEDDELDLYEF
jgi:hypothetical protein